MGDFVLKRFEVEGLNCFFADVSIGQSESRIRRLSDIICQISQKDGRFRFELRDGRNQKPKISRLYWSASAERNLVRRSDQFYELESTANGHTKTEFRYTISDQFGQLVESNVDAIRPIFSSDGPTVENGYSVRIDLIAISLPHTGHSPLLARMATKGDSWMTNSDLIMDL